MEARTASAVEPVRSQTSAARMQAGGHGGEGNVQRLDGAVGEARAEELDHLLALEHAARQIEVHEREHGAPGQAACPLLEASSSPSA
jgi:hypothetical protein